MFICSELPICALRCAHVSHAGAGAGWARLPLTSAVPLSREIQLIVEGVIQGEVRVLSASMTIRDMFSGRQNFRRVITDNVCPLPTPCP